jgi:hypothetical protein
MKEIGLISLSTKLTKLGTQSDDVQHSLPEFWSNVVQEERGWQIPD